MVKNSCIIEVTTQQRKEFLSWYKLRITQKNLVINIFPLRKGSLLKFGIIWGTLIEKLANDQADTIKR